MTILLVIAILVGLILVHELGHFLAAKFFGVKVEEFGVGYPPRAFTFGKWGGTEYTLNWLPFGGFVRLFGESGEENGAGSFASKNRGVQATILFAGVAMNIVAAWALFAGALYIGTPRVVDTVEPGTNASLIIADVIPGSPAESAGLVAGDEITSVKGTRTSLSTLTPEAMTNFVSERGGESLAISYVRGGEERTISITPAHAVTPETIERPAIGVRLALVTSAPLPFFESLKGAFISTYNAFTTVVYGLWSIVHDVATGGAVLENLVGPVGLVGVAGSAAESGIGTVLTLAAFISVNLFVINLLPIPALDGGRLFILGIESIIRRSAPRVAVQLVNALGIALIIFLMVAVTWHDITRLLT